MFEKEIDTYKPLVTVIVPVYNVAPYLRQCLDTIVNQTYSYLEVIIVDDGSTDGSELICDEYAERDPRVKVVHKANGGLSSARNAGMALMQGDWVLFVDSDDWIELNTIAYLLAHKAEDADIVEFAFRSIYADDSYSDVLRTEWKGVFRGALQMMVTMHETMGVAWNKLYSSSVVSKLRFIEGRYHEDTPFVLEVLGLDGVYQYLPIVGYNYRREREGQITSGFTEKRIDMFRNIEALFDKYRGSDLVPYLQTWYVYCAKNYYFELYIQSRENRQKKMPLLSPWLSKARRLPFLSSSKVQRLQWRAFQLMPSIYAFLVVHVQPVVKRLLGRG